MIELPSNVRLAELKPIAQVEPDAIELPMQSEGNLVVVRLGDLMTDTERVVVINLYINANSADALPGDLPDTINILKAQIRYDRPGDGKTSLLSEPVTVQAALVKDFQVQPDPQVQNYVLALAKYRQTQLAEDRLKQGDRTGAATMLQSAAKTALQMGDQKAATVLQSNATRLQSGNDLSESERKTTRIISKTVLQKPANE
jgi:Ca-activated chloride channel family protein